MAPSKHDELTPEPGPERETSVPPVTIVTDRLEKPSLDDRLYRVVCLDNQLEALLVHDPETDKASAALDVNVGNFSDEDGMPGMAHAVEHLLFMGTKKFPIENEYSQYLSSNSGSSNAYTGPTSTNYFFDVAAKPANDEDPSEANPSPLYGGLDRFAQFFIEPLFLDNTVERELKAVDSENKKNLQNDTWRLHQLEKSLSNPKHPYCHFSTGNFEVLKTLPEEQGINVRDKFIEFHGKHYSANRMKLVVLGREPLDVLQKWVTELFSPIINKQLVPNRWEDEQPLRPTDLGMQCFAKPVMDSRELNLFFPFIDEEHLFESQPSRYLSHLIGHEGPGSIMSYIKAKGWANGLSAGAYPVCPGTAGIFDIQVRLTEEGLKNYPEIVKIVFQYISLLRESSPQEWIFQEQKGMADVDFKFKQKTPASRFTSRISSVMQKPLPREWLLSGHSRLRTFEPKLIQKGLERLRPDNFRMTIVSRNFPGNWDKKEKWYGTEYRYEKIPDDLMRELEAAATISPSKRLSKLHLPHKNNFIPSQLEVEKRDISEPARAPRVVRNDAVARTWWKKDDTFWVPRANVIVSLKTPVIHSSAENNVKARLFTDLVRDALEEYSYDAELAGLQYSVGLDSRGLILDISGYNDKLPVLLEQVATAMRDLNISDDRFDIVKERLTRGYNNWQLQSSYHQVGDYTSWLNAEDRDFIVEELAAELSHITAEAVRLFHKQMLSQLFIEIYVHGNMYKEDALKITDMVESTLKPRILPQAQLPILRSLILPPGSNYVFNKTLKDPENVNHCIETWFYVGDKGDREVRAKTQLLYQMIHEPAFDQLRTKEQLGYIVFSSFRHFSTTYGLRFLLQSERDPVYLDTRVEAFLAKFGDSLDEMSDTEFEGHKRSLINRVLEKLRNLDQESSRHWAQISNGYYDFEAAQLDASYVKTMEKSDMVNFFQKYFDPKSTDRARISIHLHARGALELDEKLAKLLAKLDLEVPAESRQSLDLLEANLRSNGGLSDDQVSTAVTQAKELGLKQAPEGFSSETSKGGNAVIDNAVEITDVRHYKASLLASSGARPIKETRVYLVLVVSVATSAFSFLHLALELPGQLAVKTSSLKKRKISSRPRPHEQDPLDSPSPDSVLPSCEPNDDAAFSFTAGSVADGLESPSYLRADSIPASSLPPRLQTQANSLVSADYASSTASSPCASAYADLTLDSDRGGDETGPVPSSARSQSPFRISKRAIMNGDADVPHRSSSPLKRRASSMDPENENETSTARDVEMGASQPAATDDDAQAAVGGARAMSVDAPESPRPTTERASSPSKPPLLEQVKIIETLLSASAEAPLKEGDKAYLVSRSWVNRALALRGDRKDEGGLSEESLGPVDNSDIIEETVADPSGGHFVRLKPGADLENFELFPEDAWKMVADWYGVKDNQEPIIRHAVNTAADAQSEPNIMYEFHPPIFRVYRLWSEVSPLPIEQSLKARNPSPLVISRSRKYHAQTFLKELKNFTGIPTDRKVRLWSVPRKLPGGDEPKEPRPALTPPDSPDRSQGPSEPQDSWSKLLLDVVSFSEVRDEKFMVPIPDQTGNANYNGKAAIQLYDLATDQTIVIDESIDKFWVSTYTGKNLGNEKSIPSRGNALAPSSASSGRSSPAPSGPFTRGRTQQKRTGRSIGAVGLQNLGNTCYMNSALQCVRSVEELTKYFITDAYSGEVNKTNPLGYNGKVAMAYGNLLKEIYTEGRGSVSPRDFKMTVGKCRSTFSGWGQQDSQEFLGFLLDGLQEDLSRVKKKPYIEKPDSTDDMINDPEAVRKMAEEVWDITRRRDDSVIADLFTGMYKSTLKCPECGKISITFDPFNNLTLPLPVENVDHKIIKFFPLNDVPVMIDVELSKHSSIDQLKQFLAIRTGVPPERLIGAEEFKDRFFKVYDDAQDVTEEIQKNDIATFHELEAIPTNWPRKAHKKFRSMLDVDSPPQSSEWDDPGYERMVVPVFHRRPHGYGRAQEGTSPPHFIILSKEEASNIDLIRRKVLEKVATFSTWSRFKESAAGADKSTNGDAEMVMTSASDAESSGDSKVIAHSVEGEDDLVDVTMKETADPPDVANKAVPRVLKLFNKRRPVFVEKDSFLEPELQNLFDLSYFTDNSDGAVPTGWSSVDATRALPKLADRIPEPSIEEDDQPSPESYNSNPSGNEDESNDESQKTEEGHTRMMDESSEDEPSPAARLVPRPSNGPRKKFKGKHLSKKANKRREKQMRANKHAQRATVKPQPMPPAVADGGPLIRLGEGLVVDWADDAWDMVFGGSARDAGESQGSRTFVDVENLQDPALRISRRRREHRKSRGITLEECLDEFERAEVLSEQDMWYCPRCKEHRRASKKFDLWKTPDILVAHLKRFSSSGWRRDKLDVLVDFPVEGLDLTTRVIEKRDSQPEIYDLIAVDDHYGGLGGGHYTAYAKNFVDGRWYNYNDSSVSPISDPSTAITSAAYLLFYRRRSSVPLGGSRFAEIFDKYSSSNEDGSDAESGEDQRLGGGSSLTGSSDAGTGAAAARHQGNRGSVKQNITALAGTDDEGDNDPPPYDGNGTTIHHSIEDEGVSMDDGYQQLGAKSLNMTQEWSFNAIGGSGAEDSTGADCASDDVQLDSSSEDHGLGQELEDRDTEMTIGDEGNTTLTGLTTPAATRKNEVISIPPLGSTNRDSEEVTEIHLDGDKGTKAD